MCAPASLGRLLKKPRGPPRPSVALWCVIHVGPGMPNKAWADIRKTGKTEAVAGLTRGGLARLQDCKIDTVVRLTHNDDQGSTCAC